MIFFDLILKFFTPKVIIWCIVIAVVAIAGTYGYNKVYELGAASVQTKWDKVEQERSRVIEQIKLETEKKNLEIVTKAAAQQKVLNEKIVTLNKSLNTALASLSNRPDRPSPGTKINSTGIESAKSCTGAELYRPDAEFLVREATRADEMKLYWEQCQLQYNLIREKIND